MNTRANVTSLKIVNDVDELQYKDDGHAVGPIDELEHLQEYTSLLHLVCSDDFRLFEFPALPLTLLTFDCHDNKIEMLPDLPPGLQELDCSSNWLKKLPDLPSTLIKLDCGYNSLGELPPLPDHLEVLNCGWNFIEQLPQLPMSLLHLDCEGARLTSLPELPPSLETLKWAENRFDEEDDEFYYEHDTVDEIREYIRAKQPVEPPVFK